MKRNTSVVNKPSSIASSLSSHLNLSTQKLHINTKICIEAEEINGELRVSDD